MQGLSPPWDVLAINGCLVQRALFIGSEAACIPVGLLADLTKLTGSLSWTLRFAAGALP